MFFEEDSINDKLQCPLCDKRFKDPVCLPCIEFVCEQCLNDYLEENTVKRQETFKCFVCDEEHLIPTTGFPKSKRMKLLLDVKPKKVVRGKALDNFEADLNKCLEEMNQLKYSQENKETILKDHFNRLRHQIQTATERTVEQIYKCSKEIINKVDQLEHEYLEDLHGSQLQSDIENELKDAEKFCNEWTERIKSPETNEDDATNERSNLDYFLDTVKKNNFYQNNFIANFKQIAFIQNAEEIDSSLIGQIDVECPDEKKISLKELSNLSKCLDLDKNFLLELNQFSDGKLCAAYALNCDIDLRKEKSASPLCFCILDSSESLVKSFSQSDQAYYFSFALRIGESYSISNGEQVLISFHLSFHKMLIMFVISNNPENKFELRFDGIEAFKISMDAKQVYFFNKAQYTLDKYDFKLKKIESINISQDLEHLFDKDVSIKVDNDLLYACTDDKIATYQLSDMKLIKSRSILLDMCTLSKHFIDDFCILRFNDHLRFVHLKYGFCFKRSVTDLDSGSKMRALDESKLVFFNRQTKKYFISI